LTGDPIQLVEWAKRPKPVVGFDSRGDADRWARKLRDANQHIPSRVVGGLPGPALEAEAGATAGEPAVYVLARHVVGWLEVADRTLVILPKYAVAANAEEAGALFGRILEYSQSGRFSLHGLASGSAAPGSIAEIFAHAFLGEIQPALQQGLPHGYVRRRIRGAVLSGRLRYEALYPEVISAPHLLPQDAQRYQADIPVSRLLKWCCWSLRRLVRSPTMMGRLAEVESRFIGVPPLLPDESFLRHLRLPPSLAHFQQATDLACLLARNRLVSPGTGRQVVPGFVFSGWHVFQEYSRRLLREAVRLLGAVWRLSSGRTRLALPGGTAMRSLACDPDFHLLHADRVVAAMDAKYKRPAKALRPDEANVYQAICAARALHAPNACLIQPGLGPSTCLSWSVVGTGMPRFLRVITVNPSTLASRAGHREHVRTVAGLLQDLMSARGTPAASLTA